MNYIKMWLHGIQNWIKNRYIIWINRLALKRAGCQKQQKSSKFFMCLIWDILPFAEVGISHKSLFILEPEQKAVNWYINYIVTAQNSHPDEEEYVQMSVKVLTRTTNIFNHASIWSLFFLTVKGQLPKYYRLAFF